MPSRQGPRLRLQLSGFDHPKNGLPALIDSHPICSALQLIHPSSKCSIITVDQLQPAGYITSSIQISDLVAELTSLSAGCVATCNEGKPPVAEKTGVTALALGPCMDHDGGAAISNGVLHLTVGRALYETLGLTGRNSPANPGAVYHISVDLGTKGMRAGKPLYERVIERLKTLPASRLAIAGCTSPASASTSFSTAQTAEGPQKTNSPERAHMMSAGPQAGQPADQDMPDVEQQQQKQRQGQQHLDLPSMLSCLKAPSAKCKHHSLQASSWVVTGVVVPRLRRADITDIALAQQQQQQQQLQALPEFISLQGSAPLPRNTARSKQRPASSTQPSTQQVQGMQVDGGPAGQPVGSTGQEEVRLQQGLLQGLVDYLGAVSCRMSGAMCTELLPEPLKHHAGRGEQLQRHGSTNGGEESTLGDSLAVQQWQGLIVTDTVHQLLAAARKAVSAGDLPWAAMSVWGWEHSPVGWSGLAKQGGAVGVVGTLACVGQGANTQYTVVVLEGGQDYLVVQGLGASDMPFS